MDVAEGQRRYKVVFAGSLSVLPTARLANPPYPAIAEDFARSIRILESLRPDVFLGAHASFIDLEKELEKRKASAASNPFIDPEGYRTWLARAKAQFEARLVKDRSLR
jgi:metallo-beta-lactamase class B